jgi:hypothetical protein
MDTETYTLAIESIPPRPLMRRGGRFGRGLFGRAVRGCWVRSDLRKEEKEREKKGVQD